MSRHSLTGVLVAASLVVSSAAFAQNGGTEAEQDACTPDVFRLCDAYIPNEAPIVACLKLKRTQLSPACYNVFFATANGVPHRHRRHRAY